MSDLFDFDPPPPIFAVVGNPVTHSVSPEIHAAFGAATGIKLQYDRMQVDIGGFPQAIDNFKANGGRGLNITVPFKGEAFRYADCISPRARAAEAVNTLRFDAGSVFGENTDGLGLVTDVTSNLNYTLGGRRILIIGAGGAVSGVVGPLLEESPAVLVIANRTVDRAARLVQRIKLSDTSTDVRGVGLNALQDEEPFDIVVNGTSAGLSGNVAAVDGNIFAKDALAYDMVYGPAARSFCEWALARGASIAVDGLGMLVEQAAESFHCWHGVRPPTDEVIRNLRSTTSAD